MDQFRSARSALRLPADAYWMAGYMGQTTMINASRDLVMVRQGPSRGATFSAWRGSRPLMK